MLAAASAQHGININHQHHHHHHHHHHCSVRPRLSPGLAEKLLLTWWMTSLRGEPPPEIRLGHRLKPSSFRGPVAPT